MRRTTLGDLAVPFFVFGVTAYVLLRIGYDSIPPLQYAISFPLAGLALVEFVASRRVRAAVRHDPRAKPMAALVIARCVALGKASALVAAGIVGAAVALFIRVVPDAGRVRAAANDVRVSIFLVIGAGLLVAAGLLLERSGVDPGSDGEDGPRVASG
jgi:Protein of unknown function (DUF3180)